MERDLRSLSSTSSAMLWPGGRRNIWVILETFRPWSFIMTAVSVMVGSLLGLLLSGQFNPWLVILVLVGVVAVHGATNILNDFFDTFYGIDRPGSANSLYRTHPILGGVLTLTQIIKYAVILYIVAALIGIYLVYLRGWVIAVIAVTGCLAGFTYTAGPIKYKYRGMGEISVFLMWGPFMTFGSYFVQTGNWDGLLAVLMVSVPLGIWVALVLLANNLKDLKNDGILNIKTVAVKLGKKKALKLFAGLTYVIYLISGLGIITGYFPLWSFLVFLTLPLALKLINNFTSQANIPVDADPQTAQFAAIYGGLLTLSLLLEHFTSFI